MLQLPTRTAPRRCTSSRTVRTSHWRSRAWVATPRHVHRVFYARSNIHRVVRRACPFEILGFQSCCFPFFVALLFLLFRNRDSNAVPEGGIPGTLTLCGSLENKDQAQHTDMPHLSCLCPNLAHLQDLSQIARFRFAPSRSICPNVGVRTNVARPGLCSKRSLLESLRLSLR